MVKAKATTGTGKKIWRNRIIRYAEESPEMLLANPFNFRVHPRLQQEALTGVLDEIGFVQDVIVNVNSGHLVDGHLRVMLALRDEQPLIPVKYVDLTDEEERKVLATLDPISALAIADGEQYQRLTEDLEITNEAIQAVMDTVMKSAKPLSSAELSADVEKTLTEHQVTCPHCGQTFTI